MTNVEVSTDATGPLSQVVDVTQGPVQEVVEELTLDPALGLCDRPAKEQQQCRDECRALEGALVPLVELVLAVQQQRTKRFGPGRHADRPPVTAPYCSTRGASSIGYRRDVDAQVFRRAGGRGQGPALGVQEQQIPSEYFGYRSDHVLDVRASQNQ